MALPDVLEMFTLPSGPGSMGMSAWTGGPGRTTNWAPREIVLSWNGAPGIVWSVASATLDGKL